jgi:hypothetical protein
MRESKIRLPDSRCAHPHLFLRFYFFSLPPFSLFRFPFSPKFRHEIVTQGFIILTCLEAPRLLDVVRLNSC